MDHRYTGTGWNILLVDDDEEDYILVRHALADITARKIKLHWAASVSEGLLALRNQAFDAVLVDYYIEYQNGLEFIRTSKQEGFRLPFILLTGQDNYELDVAAMQAGASDFLAKSDAKPQMLERSIRYAIERERLLEENRLQTALFQKVFEVNPDGLAIITGDDLRIQLANPAYRLLTPHPERDPLGQDMETVWPPAEGFQSAEAVRYVIDTQQTMRVDRQSFQYPDGSQRTLAFHLQPHIWQGRTAALIVLWEITALEKARERAESAAAAAEQSAAAAEQSAAEAERRAAEAEEGRRVLQAIMDNLPESLIIAEGPDAVLRMISKHTEQLTELPFEMMIGQELDHYPAPIQVFDATGRNPVAAEDTPLLRAIQKGEVITNEEVIIRNASGRLVAVSCNSAPIRNASGQITGGMIAMRDITESKRLENALRLSESKFRTIFDANVIPLMMWHIDGQVLEANDAYLNLVGYTRQELKDGKLFWKQLTAPEHLPLAQHSIEEMAIGLPATPFEQEYVLRNGRRVPVLIGGALIGDYGDRGWSFAVDLTERKQAEARLAYHARLLENVHDAIIATDEMFVITAWNRAAEDLYGWQASEVIGRPLSDVLHSQFSTEVFHEALDSLSRTGAYRLEIDQFTRDGSRIVVESSMITLRDPAGQINGYISANRDVTARIQATREREQFLRQLEQQQSQLSAVINNAPVGVVVTDAQARILLVNPVGERLIARPIPYGKEYEALAELQICGANGELCPPRDLPLTRSALDGARFENEEMQVIWPDGQRRSWLVNSSPILSPSGEIEGAVSIFQDTTEMRKAAELIQNNAAQIEIQRYLSRAREQERLTIAHDLHDGPLQEMIGLSFTLNEAVTARSEDETQQYLDNMQTHLQELIRGMRAFCNELRPPTLTPFGLERAIRSHAGSFQKAHPEIHIHLDLVHDGQLLPETVRITLFQVYRESLNNILKHAQATEVTVRLTLEQESVVLEIQDNGKGFQIPYHWVEFARQGHLGLVGMQERAEAVGGSVRLVSRPGEGTAVRVSVPLQEKSELLPQ